MYLYRNIFAEQGLKPEINDQSVSLRNDNVCFLYLPENHSLSIKDFYRSHLLVNRISEKGSIIVKLNSEVLIPEFFYRHLNKQLKEFEKDVRETIDYNTKLKYNLISVDIDYNVIENFISRSE
ncbi:hypothetical protein HOK68_01085 [Candidatus Woesearchaeota archaeon]|nr:hypothetical protein [Candidatus Woesearchaeota archaeon]